MNYRTLLIDEAHLFERNIAGVSTKNLSISALLSFIGKTTVGSAINRRRVKKACLEVMRLSKNVDTTERPRLFFPSDFRTLAKLNTGLNSRNPNFSRA